jgi:hypothetical protein
MKRETKATLITGTVLGLTGLAIGLYKKDNSLAVKLTLAGVGVGSLIGFLGSKICCKNKYVNDEEATHYAVGGDKWLKGVDYTKCQELGGWWWNGKCYSQGEKKSNK